MKATTRYAYEKRIKELERENQDLQMYRVISRRIYIAILDKMCEGKVLCQSWIVRQFMDVMK